MVGVPLHHRVQQLQLQQPLIQFKLVEVEQLHQYPVQLELLEVMDAVQLFQP